MRAELLGSKSPTPKLLGKPEAKDEPKQEKVSAQSAGYMELAGAKKTGGCLIVNVPGGISKELGCCNLFKPADKNTDSFRCGSCHFED